MLNECKIRKLLEDIKTEYSVGYCCKNLTLETEKWAQIQILEWILSE